MDLTTLLLTAEDQEIQKSYGSILMAANDDNKQSESKMGDYHSSSEDDDNGTGVTGSCFVLQMPTNAGDNDEDDSHKKVFTPRSGSFHDDAPNNEGYCLVFQRFTAYHEVIVEGDKLVVVVKCGLNEDERVKSEKVLEKVPHKNNLLRHFKRCGLSYFIKVSEDKLGFIYVIFSFSHDIGEQFADHRDLDLQIEACEAIKIGRQLKDFLLAKRTHLEIKDGNYNESLTFSTQANTNSKTGKAIEYSKLGMDTWKYIHIAYESAIEKEVYIRHNKGTLLDNRLFLRMLYEYLIEDFKMGGVGFNLPRFLREKNHPLEAIFAINILEDDEVTRKPELSANEIKFPQKESVWTEKITDIRGYYGELVAFYFSFLRHYTRWLYPIALVGTIWFIIQLVYGKIAVPGSEFIVLFSIIWSTAMIENWYRRESWLRYKWGMMSYQDSSVPRPGFSGVVEVSPGTGALIETYQNEFVHYGKMLFSASTMTLCFAIVLAVVFEIWTLKSLWGDSTEVSIAVGIVNSVQIQIMNQLYTRLAVRLNEFEEHRLEQDYYNHLVIKKITFFVVNSFNSLFYIAFYKEGYESKEQCLDSVRTQLLTLFLTAIFLQNAQEIILPKIFIGISTYLKEKKNRENQEKHEEAGKEIMPSTTQYIENPHETFDTLTRQASSEIAQKTLQVSDEVWADVDIQIAQPESPDVLMNTSEMVIQYGYIMLFVFVFPAMPLLACINNFFEVRVDLYNLINCRRPAPQATNGIGVWKGVISIFGTVAVFTNMALITFKTDIISDYIGSTNNEYKIEFFFISSFVLLALMFIVRFAIDDMTVETKQAIERQEQCNKYLLLNSVKKVARERKHKHGQKRFKKSN